MRKYFGTDGIRGVANEHPMTPEIALSLGRAVAYLFKRRGGLKHRKIVVGKDTRRSCYMFENALAAGIASMGADCLLCGPLPTPGVAHVTSSMRADAGVVISASHNPFEDNGIKIFASDGFKLPDETEAELERLMASAEIKENLARGDDIGMVARVEDVRGRYVQFLKQTFPRDLLLDGIKIVVDCANGAAYRVASCVFEELGADVVSLSVSPDGCNINANCGALFPEQLMRAVSEEKAALGIALDGDADRVVFVDERGRVVNGDAILALITRKLLDDGKLAQETLVTTVMSSMALDEHVRNLGGRSIRVKVGDRYVVEAMRCGGFNFGGEQSGHLVLLDYMTTGDGVIAALQVLEAMIRYERPISYFGDALPSYPQVLINIEVNKKRPLEELEEVARLVCCAERKLGDRGRVLVRYSGTEAVGRVLVEGPDLKEIEMLAQRIGDALCRACL